MNMRGWGGLGLIVAALLLPGTAFGQGNPNTPPPSPGPPPVNLSLSQPPPADRPLVTNIPAPRWIAVDGGAGILGYIGGTGRVGPSWNVRVTADFSRRFALEGNYLGSVNQRSDNTGTLVYNALDADLRYNILRADEAPVQPYLSGGIGWAGWFGPGGTPASLVLPVAVGIERLLTERIRIGARFNLRPTFFADLGHGDEKNPPGGSTWTMTLNAGGMF